MSIWLSQSAKNEFDSFSPENKASVGQIMALLENRGFREVNKIDLCVKEEGHDIWSMTYGSIWVAFHDTTDDDICIDWLSVRSRFR